jgi:hypothetical protein
MYSRLSRSHSCVLLSLCRACSPTPHANTPTLRPVLLMDSHLSLPGRLGRTPRGTILYRVARETHTHTSRSPAVWESAPTLPLTYYSPQVRVGVHHAHTLHGDSARRHTSADRIRKQRRPQTRRHRSSDAAERGCPRKDSSERDSSRESFHKIPQRRRFLTPMTCRSGRRRNAPAMRVPANRGNRIRRIGAMGNGIGAMGSRISFLLVRNGEDW